MDTCNYCILYNMMADNKDDICVFVLSLHVVPMLYNYR